MTNQEMLEKLGVNSHLSTQNVIEQMLRNGGYYRLFLQNDKLYKENIEKVHKILLEMHSLGYNVISKSINGGYAWDIEINLSQDPAYFIDNSYLFD